MSLTIKNLYKRPIIGTMGDGSSLRLPVGETTKITDEQYEGYVANLVTKNRIEVLTRDLTKDGVKVVKAEKKSKKK